MPYSRATIAACASGLPVSVTTAQARPNSGVQADAAVRQTNTSPGRSRAKSSRPVMLRTGPVAVPGLAARPVIDNSAGTVLIRLVQLRPGRAEQPQPGLDDHRVGGVRPAAGPGRVPDQLGVRRRLPRT